MRRILVILLPLALVTACSPVPRGYAGVTLDAQGAPVVAVAWCKDSPPSEIIVYVNVPKTVAGEERLSAETVLKLTATERPTGTYAEVPLTTPTPGWTADPPGAVLRQGVKYHVYAPVKGNGYTAPGTDFTLERLRGSGQILHGLGTDSTKDSFYTSEGLRGLVRPICD